MFFALGIGGRDWSVFVGSMRIGHGCCCSFSDGDVCFGIVAFG